MTEDRIQWGDTFVMIPYAFLDCEEFRTLPLTARKIVWRLVIEVGKLRGKNIRLVVSQAQFIAYGVSSNGRTIGASIKLLVKFGLIEIIDPGKSAPGTQRRSGAYRLLFLDEDARPRWPPTEPNSVEGPRSPATRTHVVQLRGSAESSYATSNQAAESSYAEPAESSYAIYPSKSTTALNGATEHARSKRKRTAPKHEPRPQAAVPNSKSKSRTRKEPRP